MKTTRYILCLIAIFLVSMAATPAYAAPKKGTSKKESKPELTRAGMTFYIDGKEAIKGRKVLEFYAQQNCEAAYKQYKRGRECYIAGWTLFGSGAAMTIAGIGCVASGVLKTANSATKAVTRRSKRVTIYDELLYAGGALIGVGVTAQLVCIPVTVVGKKKMHRSAETYNATCRYTQAKPYWSLQASENGLGFALNF